MTPPVIALGVCGLGKLGSPVAASFANAGLQVIGYDIDQQKVDDINRGFAPVDEPGLGELIARLCTRRGDEVLHPRLSATTSASELASATSTCIFVAPTPSLPDGSFDHSFLFKGIEAVAKAVGDRPYLFIVASTVMPGTCEDLLLPAIRKHCPQGHIVYKPELIALGTVLADLKEPDVSVFGANNDEAACAALKLYSKMQKSTGHCMTLIEAELAKISLNCAITSKISFANQVGMLAERLGANPHTVLGFVGSDSRIGRKCLKPGMPYGGPCFPRDNRMFQHAATKAGCAAHLAVATDLTNLDVYDELLSRVLRLAPDDGAIGILGLAYKPGIKFSEEGAGEKLRRDLERMGRTVHAYDPLLPADALAKAMACRIVIVTMDTQEFRNLEFRPDTVLLDPMAVTRGLVPVGAKVGA